MSTNGVVPFVPPPLLLPVKHVQKPRLSSNPQNCIVPNPLHPPVLTSECITKWLTPYGIAKLDTLALNFPIDIITHHCLCIINSIQPLTLSNYSTGLLHLSKFCDNYKVPEVDCMPASESMLSLFIAPCGMGSVSKGAIKSWLEGIHMWHEVNDAPWYGSHIFKRVISGTAKFTPPDSIQPKHDPVTIEHLHLLCHNLDLSNSFDIAIFTLACVAFWCCCW